MRSRLISFSCSLYSETGAVVRLIDDFRVVVDLGVLIVLRVDFERTSSLELEELELLLDAAWLTSTYGP